MTAGSGRCHGPGCTQTAVVEFWCSEACQARWDRQLAEADAPRSVEAFRLHDGSFVDQPLTSEWTVRVAIDGHLSEDSARTFADAADRAAEMVSEATYSGTASSVMEDILRAYEHIEQVTPAVDGDSTERVCDPGAGIDVHHVDMEEQRPRRRRWRWPW